MTMVQLPTLAGVIESYSLGSPMAFPRVTGTHLPRVAYSAVHVVADPLADLGPWGQTAIDWDATLAYRRYLWGLGLGVAEAMDTAQRGMGLDWPTALELIGRAVPKRATSVPGRALPAAPAPIM